MAENPSASPLSHHGHFIDSRIADGRDARDDESG
jgi:hypothetical protein